MIMTNNIDVLNILGATIIYEPLLEKYYAKITNIFGTSQQASIYFLLSDKLVSDNSLLQYIFYDSDEGRTKTDILTNINNLIAGEDYWLSETMFDIAAGPFIDEVTLRNNITMPDFTSKTGDIVTTWLSSFITSKLNSINNYKQYIGLNNIADSEFSEDDIYNFATTFLGIILSVSDDIDMTDSTNVIRKKVLEYWKSNATSSTLTDLQLILSSSYATGVTTSTSTCSCNDTSSSTINTVSCVDIYTSAMKTLLNTVFSDLDFYCCWFFDQETGMINEYLVKKLISLIDALLNSGIDLSLDKSSKHGCNCGLDSSSSSASTACSNEQIIRNYRQALQWMLDEKLSEHSNQISVYGSSFAGILPNLYF